MEHVKCISVGEICVCGTSEECIGKRDMCVYGTSEECIGRRDMGDICELVSVCDTSKGLTVA